MPRVLGVDVSLGRGHDVVLIEEATVKDAWSSVGAEGLSRLLRELKPAAVGIDAPPRPGLGLLRDPAERARLPVPPRAGAHLARRVAEYELSRRGIGSHQTHYDETRLFSWMTAGFEAFDAARRAGYPAYLGPDPMGLVALEVFPYASYVVLSGCLSPGRRWRVAWRRAVLAEAGVEGLPEGAAIDTLDAACAALTVERFLAGAGDGTGDRREGVIVLPGPLRDAYRRCAPPHSVAPVHPAEPVRRLCGCGCGAIVSRRFLPGHDAKLRSQLLRAIRAGDDARRRLLELGWTVGEREG